MCSEALRWMHIHSHFAQGTPSIFTVAKAMKAMKAMKTKKKVYPAFRGTARLRRSVPPPKDKAVNYKVAFENQMKTMFVFSLITKNQNPNTRGMSLDVLYEIGGEPHDAAPRRTPSSKHKSAKQLNIL